jgi:hypothetical protein
MPISKHDKQALADLFIHMGVPLVVAMQTVESWSGGEVDDLPKRAETLSKLLTISVEFATKITKKLEIRDAYTLENVRGKIIRIVTPIMAERFVIAGEIPTEDSLGGLTDLFDVLLSFADSVSPTDDKGSKPTKIAMMIEACEPVLSAIAEDDKGQDAKSLFTDSVGGLKGRAQQLAPALGLENAIEDGLFKSIVPIFVACYKSNDLMDDVWKACDERLAIIQGLTAFVADKADIKVGKPTPKPAEKSPEPVKDSPKEDAKTDEADKDNKSDDDDDGDFNPMSFFSAGGS